MSKKYKGKLCVYCCSAQATSADHVFAREFFLISHRSNLPQVPACDHCNCKKASLEHYLTAVLPFGGKHAAALETLRDLVPKRLEKNKRLKRELAGGMSSGWLKENGLFLPGGTVPLDWSKLEALCELIARGLLWFHWRTLLRPEDVVEVHAPTELGEQFFTTVLSLRAANRVRIDLAGGTVSYEGIQASEPLQLSAWRISLYGGLTMGGREFPRQRSNSVGIITGPSSIRSIFQHPAWE